MNAAANTTRQVDLILLAIGIVLILFPLLFAVAFSQLLNAAGLYLRIIASLGGALIGASLPGILEINLPAIRAGGALAVLVMFWKFNPPQVIDKQLEQYKDTVKSRQRLGRVSGKIKTPTSGTAVEHSFDGEGSVSCIEGGLSCIKEGVYFYLAVEVSGAIWPRKEPLQVRTDGTWSSTVFQDSQTPEFSLILLAANDNGQLRIEDWLARSQRLGGSFERMDWNEDIVRLARIDLRLKEK